MTTIGAAHIRKWLNWLDEAVSDLEALHASGETLTAPSHMQIMRAYANTKSLRESIRSTAIADIQVQDTA